MYFGDMTPLEQKGMMILSSDTKLPVGYDQTGRGWFTPALASEGIIATEPYIDGESCRRAAPALPRRGPRWRR